MPYRYDEMLAWIKRHGLKIAHCTLVDDSAQDFHAWTLRPPKGRERWVTVKESGERMTFNQACIRYGAPSR